MTCLEAFKGMLREKRGSFPLLQQKELSSLLPVLSCTGSVLRQWQVWCSPFSAPCPVLAVLKGGDPPEWQHRQTLILAGPIWHNYDTNRSWRLEMLPGVWLTKLPLLLLGVEEVRELSNLLHAVCHSWIKETWTPKPLAISRCSHLLAGGAPCLSGVLADVRAVPGFQVPEHGCLSKRGGFTHHTEQLRWLSLVGPHPQIGKLSRDEFTFCAGRRLGRGTGELCPFLHC